MAIFEIALAYVLANEGGFVNNPLDSGGPTNQGITQKTLSAHLGRPASIEDVQNISKETVAAIYRKGYWAVIKGDSIKSQSTATFLMDMAVLMGPAQATKIAQAAVGATPDGILGPKTLTALNAVASGPFALRFSKGCVRLFVNITVAKPSQLAFLPGWVSRADEMTSVTLV